LLTACFGKAVREFGEYENVEKADGSDVTVAELLEMTRQYAFDAVVSDIDTDPETRFYIGWLNLFGFSEASHDDVRRITQIGLNIDLAKLNNNNILIRTGNKEKLANYSERIDENKQLGDKENAIAIDKVHKAMHLIGSGNRETLLEHINQHAPAKEHPFWRVINSLLEILPQQTKDYKQAAQLMTNKDTLIHDAKNSTRKYQQKGSLFDNA
ncbi:MAG: DUF1156 domain-containing protein, partial [bacterium]|nr:DUF1156 domain-containing protein [bacterium]